MNKDFPIADLPRKTLPFWKLVGPGVILVGLSIGSGELILWPRLTAVYGEGMIWAALFGVFIQVWINFELGRYTICTGESVYTGFARVSGFFPAVFLLLNLLGGIMPAWATGSGAALKALLTGTPPEGNEGILWTWISMGIVAGLLFGPKLIYTVVEKVELGLVATITLGLIVAAFVLGTPELWGQLWRGATNVFPPQLHPDVSRREFFAALVYAGAGGTSNIYLCYYLRDKNLGMGARIPDIVNPLRGQTEKVPSTGFLFAPTEENVSRFREWFTHFRKEQVLIFWFLNSFTIMLFIFGGLVVHNRGNVAPDVNVVEQLAGVMASVIGPLGKKLFLLVAFATLFSTQLAIIDGAARTFSDIIYVSFPRARERSLSWWYAALAGGWMLTGGVISLFNIPSLIQFNTNACIGGIAMALYVPMTLYVNYRFLPKPVRPGPVNAAFVVLASLVYISFAVWFLGFGLRSR